jgi:hypothetical protein
VAAARQARAAQLRGQAAAAAAAAAATTSARACCAALGASHVAPRLGAGLVTQLCGRCPAELTKGVAYALHWFVHRFGNTAGVHTAGFMLT